MPEFLSRVESDDPDRNGILQSSDTDDFGSGAELVFTRHEFTIDHEDTPTEETTVDTEVKARNLFYEGLLELPAGSILLGAGVRTTEAWVAANADDATITAVVRSAGFEHGVTDDWMSVDASTALGMVVASGANQSSVGPLGGDLHGRLVQRDAVVGVQVSLVDTAGLVIPSAPTAGTVGLVVVVAAPTA